MIPNDDPVSSDLSPAALAAAIAENEIRFNLYRARVAGWEVHQDHDLTWYYNGWPDAYSNGVLRATLSPAEADARIDEMLAWFDARRVPMVWWSGPGRSPDDLGARLIARGLEWQGDDPGMAADLHDLPADLPLPAGCVVERVRDERIARLWLRTHRIGNDGDPDVAHVPLYRFGPASFDDDDPLRLYLARLDGAPVATAKIYFGGGVAGLYWVATVPSARRQGIGAAVTLAALRDARATGYRIGVLGASSMGFSVYQRLGFRQYCALTLYTRER